MKPLRILMLGDVVGTSGMGALFLGLRSYRRGNNIDFVVVNGENATSGFGISLEDYGRIIETGVDVITSGNHIWEQNDILIALEKNDDILRPANYPEGVPGKGMTIKKRDGVSVAVINLQGRLSMIQTDDPFKRANDLVREAKKVTPLILVDFHAEEVMEKEALGAFLDGRVTAVVGTHTHVQTADQRILPGGTAYITDLGLTGAPHEVIGGSPEKAIERQLTQLPIKSEPSANKGESQGVLIEADRETGKALSIERIVIS